MAGIRKLQGKVLEIMKTGEFLSSNEGEKWEKCVFTLEITSFSKRTPNEVIPDKIQGKKVKLVRYCLYDWHYRLGITKTLEPDETEAVLSEKPTKTIYW